jgi:hypothetical protein
LLAIDYPNQFNNRWEWFGRQQGCRVAIWPEIDRRAVTKVLVDAGAIHAIWLDNLSRKFIPAVEACHKGAIPLASVNGVLLIDRHDLKISEWLTVKNAKSDAIAKFEDRLPQPPLESELLEAIRASME